LQVSGTALYTGELSANPADNLHPRVKGEKMNTNRIVRAAVLCLCLAIVSQIAHSQTVRIGGWALTNNGQIVKNFVYTGSCPVKLQFAWGVLSTAPTEIKYHFERSDGAQAPPGQMGLPRANTSEDVITTWDLGANIPRFADFTGWEELVIDSPNRVSQKINFTLHCTPATVRIGGWALTSNGQIVKNFEYTGSCPVPLQFAWGVLATAPMEIKYHFERSDGAKAPPGQKMLPKANTSVDVLTTWELGANIPRFADFKGWEDLVIDTPNRVSQKINFTLHCR
jgi:hypothetical protein